MDNSNQNLISNAVSQVVNSLVDFVSKVFDPSENSTFPFSKFRDLIVERYKHGERNNLGKPTVVQIVISSKDDSRNKCKVSLSLYYKNDDGIKRMSDEYEINQITDIPPAIMKSLKDNGSEKITFDASDLDEIYGNRELPISTDGENISTQIYKRISQSDSATVNITDFVLYYRVRIYMGKDGSETCNHEFLTSKIVGLNKDSMDLLSTNHEVNLVVKP